MHADAHPHLDLLRPAPAGERALDGHGSLDGGARPLEHREELVGPGIDLTPARSTAPRRIPCRSVSSVS